MSKLYLTTRIPFAPTPEQEDVLWHLSERCRLLYNFALAERLKAWSEGVRVRYVDQSRALPLIKRRYPEYGWVYSKVLQDALRRLEMDFRSFLALRRKGHTDAMPPRFKGRHCFFTMTFNQSGFRIALDGVLTLSQFYPGCSGLSFSLPLLWGNLAVGRGRIKQVSISLSDRTGWYSLSLVREVPEKPCHDNSLYQAIDLGITKLVTAVNTRGKFFEARNPRYDKYWNHILDRLQSLRDRCKKGSRRWLRLHLTMRKCQRRLSNQIYDLQHKLSLRMVKNTRANTLIVGKLQVKALTRSGKAGSGLNRSTQNQGFLSRFARFLAYKCALVGKKLVGIDEANTSRECCACGKDHRMPLGRRVMECDCGNWLDRDRNSAVNLMARFLSQNAMWTGYLEFSGNLRQQGLTVRPAQDAPPVRVE